MKTSKEKLLENGYDRISYDYAKHAVIYRKSLEGNEKSSKDILITIRLYADDGIFDVDCDRKDGFKLIAEDYILVGEEIKLLDIEEKYNKKQLFSEEDMSAIDRVFNIFAERVNKKE